MAESRLLDGDVLERRQEIGHFLLAGSCNAAVIIPRSENNWKSGDAD